MTFTSRWLRLQENQEYSFFLCNPPCRPEDGDRFLQQLVSSPRLDDPQPHHYAFKSALDFLCCLCCLLIARLLARKTLNKIFKIQFNNGNVGMRNYLNHWRAMNVEESKQSP
jgi:hypothetical protein